MGLCTGGIYSGGGVYNRMFMVNTLKHLHAHCLNVFVKLPLDVEFFSARLPVLYGIPENWAYIGGGGGLCAYI